jgi:hypothetical protein
MHRARLVSEVREDRLDHHRIIDARDDAHRAAAARAGLDVHAEHAREALCRSAGVRASAFADCALPLPRPARMTSARCALLGANTPW